MLRHLFLLFRFVEKKSEIDKIPLGVTDVIINRATSFWSWDINNRKRERELKRERYRGREDDARSTAVNALV